MNRQVLVALGSGVLFGLGLAVSQMINPAKVLAFLDVAGQWDPSLALVMAAALLVMAPAWRLQGRLQAGPWYAAQVSAPRQRPDAPLVAGAVLFGVGWGLVGYCPGPAFAALGMLGLKPLVFVLAMLAGMQLHARWQQRQLTTRVGETCGS